MIVTELRRVWRWLATSIAVVIIPFIGLLAGSDSALAGDVPSYHLPTYAWSWQSILSGDSPFWGNWYFAGQNVLGAGQAGIFYPFNVIFGLIDPPVALRWWIVLHIVLGATGAFLWAWRSWRSQPASAVVAIAYGLNGFFILHLVHMNFTVCSAWLPWVFLGSDMVADRWSLKRASLIVFPLAAIAISGGPQILWITIVGLALYTVVRLSRRGVGPWPWVRIVGAVGIGVGLASVQLIPLYLFSRTSERPSLSFIKAMDYSMQPKYLLTSFLPHVWGGGSGIPGLSAKWTGGMNGSNHENYHEVSTHVGIAVLMLGVVALFAFRRDRRVIALGLVAVLGALMAIGDATPFAHLAFDVVPGASVFRGWARNIVLADLALTMLAGAGMKAIIAAPSRWAKGVMIASVMIAAAIVVLPALGDFGGTLVGAGDRWMALWFPALVLVAFAGAVVVMCRSPRIGSGLVVGLISLNMIVFALAAPWRTVDWPGNRVASNLDSRDRPAITAYDAAGGVDRWVATGTVVPFEVDPGTPIFDGSQMINGYDPLLQRDFAHVTGAYSTGLIVGDRLWSPGWMADVLRITTVVTDQGFRPAGSGWQPFGTVAGSSLVTWARDPRLPEAYVVHRVEQAGLEEITKRLLDERSNLRRTVYVEPSATGDSVLLGSGGPDAGRSSVEGSLGDHGTGRFTVISDESGVLVISTAWLDGWTAKVNGRCVPVVRADGLTLALPIEAGTNDVVLVFDPPGFTAGLALTLLSLVLFLGAGLVASRSTSAWIRAIRPHRRRASRSRATDEGPPVSR